MFDYDVNWLAVLVSAVASMAIGYVWYAKWFLGKTWMMLIGKTEEDLKKGAGSAMFLALICAVVSAFVLAVFVNLADAATVSEGLMLAFWIWLGFVVTVLLMNVAFEQRSKKLFLINAFYQLISLGVASMILVAWT